MCFILKLCLASFLSGFVHTTMALLHRFQAVARRSATSYGRNALQRTPLRSYSSSASVDGTLPLAGIRVLDMTRVLAGVSGYLLIAYGGIIRSKLTDSSHTVLKYWAI